MMKYPFISVIFPVEKKTAYLTQALEQYARQTYRHFEVIISSTRPVPLKHPFVSVVVNPHFAHDVSSKRNVVLTYASGTIFVFNDDDVYVPPDYLAHVKGVFANKQIVAACGPLLTPPDDSFMQKASGAVWESYLGSFGAGMYRSKVMSRRTVYDYPAANLVVRADVFKTINGFTPHLFPGEDTKLCLDIVNTFGKGVTYDPRLVAYHHRKALFHDHLRQVGRYGTQRGWFAITYPETSFRIQYFLPAALTAYILLLPFIFVTNVVNPVYALVPLIMYGMLAAIEGSILAGTYGITIAGIATAGIISTHMYYGICFSKSFAGKIVSRVTTFIRLVTKKME
ncbi:hypothetical protein A3B56_02795 [Candidatus Roizmanbacteria bacterium RIFCSPLOWO2_01_FULL_45_11]|uniref:Glycosyltransferase 2-like domain-containing protein n=1 Tax=Candidatus Roizmanbacteria bacterium RIFCSPLOWO2_01_FULL_45_11 TaxID=1802070 RepID=A0A1F7JHS4_9BACT|nr:MAG: hypothetical protein A3B56_02795 [Candidatus Roizmanbacteria bacterium RIFCSPLOWO2_01_FULL_45_11]